MCFLHYVFLVIAVFIGMVVEMKALILIAHWLCAYIEYFQRVFEMFNANIAALQLTEPAVITAVKDDATSENGGGCRVKATGPGKRSKKPFKEKTKIGANETGNRGQLPVPVSVLDMKRARGGAERRDSIIDIVRGTGKVALCLPRNVWPEDSCATRKKGSSGDQKRVRRSLCPEDSSSVSRKGSIGGQERNRGRKTTEVNFLNVDKPSPLWYSTRSPGPYYQTGITNQIANTFKQTRNTSLINKHRGRRSAPQEERPILRGCTFSTKERVTSSASSMPCPVGLWSVDINEELVKEEPSIDSNSKFSPETTNNKSTLDSSEFSLFLRIVAAFSLLVIDAAQSVCDYVDSNWIRLADALNGTDGKLIACLISSLGTKAAVLCQSTINWAIRRLYGSVTTASRKFYRSVITTSARAKSKIGEKVAKHRSALISLKREDQPATRQELPTSSSRKDQEGTKNTGKKQCNGKVCDRLTRTEKGTRNAHLAQFDFPVRLFSLDEDWETPVNQSLNSDIVCASRGVDNITDSKIISLSQNETLREDSCSHRRKDQSYFSKRVTVHGKREQVQLRTKCKIKKDSPSESHNYVGAPLGKEKQGKANTSTEVDLPARKMRKTKERAMPRLIPASNVNAVSYDKLSVPEKSSPKLGIQLNPMTPVKSRHESVVLRSCEKAKTSSVVKREVIEDTSIRAKRRHNNLEETQSDKQAPMALTQRCGMNIIVSKAREKVKSPLGSTARLTASMKRKTGENANDTVKPDSLFLQSLTAQTKQAAGPPSEATVDGLESMETVVSVEKLLTIPPATMVINNELDEVEESFEESRAAYYELRASATANVSEPVEPMETNAEAKTENVDVEMKSVEEQVSSWNFLPFSLTSFLKAPFISNSQPAEEDMETDQVHLSSWYFSTFSLPSFSKTPLTSQTPAEETEMDKVSITVQFANEEPEEMEIYPAEAMDTKVPPGQYVNAKEAAGLAWTDKPEIGTLRRLLQQGTRGADNQLFDGCIASSPSGEITDTKRPLASTVGLLKEAAMSPQIPTAEEATSPSAVQQPRQQFVQPLVQAGILSDHLQVNSAMKPSHDYSRTIQQLCIGENATADNTSIIATLKDQDTAPTLANHLTMEQLQLVPPANDPNAYLADESDSESDSQSDDEYQLDLETIENFSELESSPDHAQLITKLLMEKESYQWHRVLDSDSDSDRGAKCEVTESLDPGKTEKYSALEDVLEISPAEAERLAKSLAEKESNELHNVPGSDADDESDN